jgi:hypothetical protein
LQPASKKLFWDRIQNNKLNIELTGFYKIVNGITASNQGFYNNFQYKMRLEVTPLKESNFWLIKRQNDSVPGLVILSVNDYEFDSFTPSTFPNNVDIRHSASLGFNYDILDNLKISVGIWRNGQPYTRPIEGNETVKAVIILWLIMVRQIVKT